MSPVPAMLGSRLLLGVLLSASAAACGSGASGPAWTFAVTPGFVETVDGRLLGQQRTLTGDQFHRLEAAARTVWREAHPTAILSAFEVRSPAGLAAPGQGSASGASSAGADDYLVVVTVVGGGRHVVALHCNPTTFPAPGSCS